MTDDIKPVAWAIFRDGALAWDSDYPFSDEPMSMMDDEESRPLYGGEVIAEIERLRADRDDVRAELTNLQVAFNDWKVTHSTVRLEVEIERLRAELAETAPLTRFGAACLIAHREDLADLDAFWLEYSAERAGCLGYVESAEPCGEDCRCAEYGDDFPTQCLRTPVNLWRLAVRIDAAMKEAK